MNLSWGSEKNPKQLPRQKSDHCRLLNRQFHTIVWDYFQTKVWPYIYNNKAIGLTGLLSSTTIQQLHELSLRTSPLKMSSCHENQYKPLTWNMY
jgi:hypothetical protein